MEQDQRDYSSIGAKIGAILGILLPILSFLTCLPGVIKWQACSGIAVGNFLSMWGVIFLVWYVGLPMILFSFIGKYWKNLLSKVIMVIILIYVFFYYAIRLFHLDPLLYTLYPYPFI